MCQLPASDNRLTEIKEHQQNDPVFKKWKTEVQEGKNRRKCMVYGDLSIHDGLMMKGERIVIPKTLQQEVLTQLHIGHQGIQKCKERARRSV